MESMVKAGIRSVPNTASIEDISAIIREDGGVILRDFLTPEQVQAFKAEIRPALNEIAPGAQNEEWDELGEFLAEFHGHNTKRLEDIVNLSPTFREEILDLDLFHALGDSILLDNGPGSYWLTATQVIEIGPGSRAQPLHRDLEVWPPFVGMGPAAPEAIVNFLIALTDFTDDNGATRVIPGSHKWPDYQERGTPEMTVPAEMKAGDAVFYSGKMLHGGGANRTSDEYRLGLTIPLILGFLTPEDALPLVVDRELVRPLPQRVQRLLGFRSHYFGGVPIWQVNGRDIGEYLGL